MNIILEIKGKYISHFFGPFKDRDLALQWLKRKLRPKSGKFDIEFSETVILAVKNERGIGPNKLRTRTEIGHIHPLYKTGYSPFVDNPFK